MINFINSNCNNLPEQNKWNLICVYRNDLLAKSDWTQLPDAPLTEEQKADWATYRQTLRDLPENFDKADDVEFPEEPNNGS